MRKVKQLNNWIIKEKRIGEVPMNLSTDHRYVVFSPTGKCQEDNLTIDQAVEFCETNLDYIQKGRKK